MIRETKAGDLSLAELERWLRRRFDDEPAPRGSVGPSAMTGLTWTVVPTLLNGWAHFDPPSNQQAAYVKDHSGFVHLRGLIRGGTVGNVTAFILPPGYRPARLMHFPILTYDSIAFIALGVLRIQVTGEVEVVAGHNDWVALDGITFDTRS